MSKDSGRSEAVTVEKLQELDDEAFLEASPAKALSKVTPKGLFAKFMNTSGVNPPMIRGPTTEHVVRNLRNKLLIASKRGSFENKSTISSQGAKEIAKVCKICAAKYFAEPALVSMLGDLIDEFSIHTNAAYPNTRLIAMVKLCTTRFVEIEIGDLGLTKEDLE